MAQPAPMLGLNASVWAKHSENVQHVLSLVPELRELDAMGITKNKKDMESLSFMLHA